MNTDMRVRFLVERKRGAAAARNRGVQTSGSSLIAFTDDDCVPDKGWLRAMLHAMESDEGCAGAGGDVFPLENNVISRYLHFCGAGRPVVFGESAIHLPTTNAIYRCDALLKVGLFEERVLICEDIHLSQKLLRSGFRLKKAAGAIVRHKDPSDIATFYRKSYLHGSGLATIARIEGMAKKRGWSDLAKDLLLSRSYVDRFSDKSRLTFSDRIAFFFLARIQKAGIHFGYTAHISSR
jgi:GT2 family glycosyltransferase